MGGVDNLPPTGLFSPLPPLRFPSVGCGMVGNGAAGAPALTQHAHPQHEGVHGVRQPARPAPRPWWKHHFFRLCFLTFYLLSRNTYK